MLCFSRAYGLVELRRPRHSRLHSVSMEGYGDALCACSPDKVSRYGDILSRGESGHSLGERLFLSIMALARVLRGVPSTSSAPQATTTSRYAGARGRGGRARRG